jgi:putative copper resistance protein D
VCYGGRVVDGLILLWLRAAGLAGQALALGGATFAIVVLRGGREGESGRALRRVLTAIGAGAGLVVAAQVGTLISLAAAFADETRWPIADVFASNAGSVGLLRLAAALLVAWLSLLLHRTQGPHGAWALLLGAAAVLPVTGALVSHATGSLETGAWLALVATVHQAAASTWAGGLVCAMVAGAGAGTAAAWLRRFSAVAAASVAALALTGMALCLVYVGSPGAAIGTSYGVMVLVKITLFAALLAMAWLNHRAVHGRLALGRCRAGPVRALDPADTIVLGRRLEAEVGLAVVALVLAASIGSTPPAASAGTPPATLEEIARVLTPGWPRLRSPAIADLQAIPGLGDPAKPRAPEEAAWSEFGHNVSGLFILAMGVLATLEATKRAPWARHWPLLIVGLTGFVAWNLDPEGWQTGRVGFWTHLLSPEVLQHRIMLACSALFGIAEWWVRTARGSTSCWRYVFPLVCFVSGTLLLTHVHEVGETQLAFLMEISHLLLGLVILVAGWARWLELRLPPARSVIHARLWGPALALFGLLLVFYRES